MTRGKKFFRLATWPQEGRDRRAVQKNIGKGGHIWGKLFNFLFKGELATHLGF